VARYCLPLLAGMVLGVLFVGVTSAALIEFTGVMDGKFHS